MNTSLAQGFIYSQSSLQDYVDCPRRFQLRYIDHLPWPAIESEPVQEHESQVAEGKAFHRMVQQYLVGIPEEKISRQASSPNLERWWRNFIQDDLGIDGYTQQAEVSLTYSVGAFGLTAKYDLLAWKPGKSAIIFDWKTYRKRPLDEWMASRIQTRVYLALLVLAGDKLADWQPMAVDNMSLTYWYADFPGQPAKITYGIQEHEKSWREVKEQILEIGTHSYFPITNDEKKCVFCAYRSYCNRGVDAGKLDQMEIEQSGLVEYLESDSYSGGEVYES